MQSWTDRIRSQMKLLGLTQEDVAEKMGITRGAITHYLSGRRIPPLKQFDKLAGILKVDPAWLQFGVDIHTKNENTKSKNTSSSHAIPVLTWEQIAKYKSVRDIKANAIKEHLPNLTTDQTHWFALRVTGDAMTSPAQTKSFHEGDLIIIDPHAQVKHGCFVISYLAQNKQATFKQYVLDGGVAYLKPLNPQYPLIKVDKKVKMIGIVVSQHNFFMS